MFKCREIQTKYSELLELHKQWCLFSESGMRERDQAQFRKQGKSLETEISQILRDLPELAMTDREIKKRIDGICQKLFDEPLHLLVVKGEVSFDPAIIVSQDEFPRLCEIIKYKGNPIKKLMLTSVDFHEPNYRQLTDSLGNEFNQVESLNFKMIRHDVFFAFSANHLFMDIVGWPHNKLKKIDFSHCNLSDSIVRDIANHLADPHNKIEEIDFRGNMERTGKPISRLAQRYFRKMAAATGRNIKVLF